jgi:hypothetical protein
VMFATPLAGPRKGYAEQGARNQHDAGRRRGLCFSRWTTDIASCYCDHDMITSEQVQAARVLLRWGQKELAATLKVSLPSIKRLGNRYRPHSPRIGRRRIHRRE